MFNFGELLLQTQHALLGEVESFLRGVAVDWKDNTILIYFYHDGPLTPEIENDYRCVGTEIIARYPPGVMIDEKITRLDYPKPLPKHDRWAYRRKETKKPTIFKRIKSWLNPFSR